MIHRGCCVTTCVAHSLRVFSLPSPSLLVDGFVSESKSDDSMFPDLNEGFGEYFCMHYCKARMGCHKG